MHIWYMYVYIYIYIPHRSLDPKDFLTSLMQPDNPRKSYKTLTAGGLSGGNCGSVADQLCCGCFR